MYHVTEYAPAKTGEYTVSGDFSYICVVKKLITSSNFVRINLSLPPTLHIA